MSNKGRISLGEKASDFTLRDNRNKEVRLSAFKGKRILLSWHPLAWTSVCAQQMKALEEKNEVFSGLNTVALGLSVDTVPSKNAWAKELGIKETQLLSDFWPHGKVAQVYGLFREKEGFSERANIIIDDNMKIVFVKVYDIPELPNMQEIIDFLKNM